jgi:hypothetical protein
MVYDRGPHSIYGIYVASSCVYRAEVDSAELFWPQYPSAQDVRFESYYENG